MQIKFPGGSYTIMDNDPKAIKIRKGFAYSFENGELVVSDNKIHIDKDDLEDKLSQGRATNKEIQDVLLYLLKKSQS